MRFKKVKLFTNNIEAEYKFYSETLGFQIINNNSLSFTAQVGWTELTFEKSNTVHKYHYCFLIPANHLQQALHWIEKRTEVIVSEDGNKIQNFGSWNADSFYFFDGSGNLSEFIARYDLDNNDNSDFDITKVLCVNEVGIPTSDIRVLNKKLEQQLKTDFWKGDFNRFGTNGSQEGLFLLPNYNIKKTWFPTNLAIKPEDLELVVGNMDKEFSISINNGKVRIALIG